MEPRTSARRMMFKVCNVVHLAEPLEEVLQRHVLAALPPRSRCRAVCKR